MLIAALRENASRGRELLLAGLAEHKTAAAVRGARAKTLGETLLLLQVSSRGRGALGAPAPQSLPGHPQPLPQPPPLSLPGGHDGTVRALQGRYEAQLASLGASPP